MYKLSSKTLTLNQTVSGTGDYSTGYTTFDIDISSLGSDVSNFKNLSIKLSSLNVYFQIYSAVFPDKAIQHFDKTITSKEFLVDSDNIDTGFDLGYYSYLVSSSSNVYCGFMLYCNVLSIDNNKITLSFMTYEKEKCVKSNGSTVSETYSAKVTSITIESITFEA